MTTDIWIWISALLTLCIFSFLYKDNPFYKFAEHLFVGVSLGYSIAITYHNAVYPKLIIPLFINFSPGNLRLIIPFALGIMYLTRFIPKLSWMFKLPIAFLLGLFSGAAIPREFQANIIRQIQGSLLTPEIFGRIDNAIFTIIVFIGIICSLIYFFFSRERKGIIKPAADLGIIFLMVGFGASFGYTVMA
ncbi:MAG: hypothetical protein ABIL05_04620, partial [candidate division WOR-3 bacterium]